MADLRRDVEHWFLARGTPHFIEGYSATRDVFTRTLPVLTLSSSSRWASALNADWRWWENVLASTGGFAFLLGVWVAINQARGLRALALARPVASARVDMAVFVLAPAFVAPAVRWPDPAGARRRRRSNLFILAAIYYFTSYGLAAAAAVGDRARWSASSRAVFGLLARALPMLLLIVALLLFTPEVWQVAANLHGPFLAATLGLLVRDGHRVPAHPAARRDRPPRPRSTASTRSMDLCDGTPLADRGRRPERGAARPTPLSRRQQGNVALVVIVSEAIQVTLVAIVMGLFFVAVRAHRHPARGRPVLGGSSRTLDALCDLRVQRRAAWCSRAS